MPVDAPVDMTKFLTVWRWRSCKDAVTQSSCGGVLNVCCIILNELKAQRKKSVTIYVEREQSPYYLNKM